MRTKSWQANPEDIGLIYKHFTFGVDLRMMFRYANGGVRAIGDIKIQKK